ncbi:hypothetical protein C8035_v006262 [Colletotrichum spinosum]|uniref:Uncharacterized protein n=1 Tax=Colletotrichum spinosum TaxID=1347390 RepID=A0A4R8Q439_9PEZI|nr:hypothetical protein C8035_v006262 [Colletotrichum spinosum]
MPTWFLPPDFTYKPDGLLKLGTVIKHPSDPTQILASPNNFPSPLALPKVETLIERNHTHSKSADRSVGFEIFAKFVEIASASSNVSINRRQALEYSTVDHEIRSFASTISRDTLETVTNLPQVRNYINRGMFGKRPVYMITGHRVALSSFTVTKEDGSGISLALSGSGPTGTTPVEAGGGISMSTERSRLDSQETAPGIIFAYQAHVIRVRGSGDVEERLFSDPDAFLTGDPGNEEELEEAVEVTSEVLGQDIEQWKVAKEALLDGEEKCIYF